MFEGGQYLGEAVVSKCPSGNGSIEFLAPGILDI